MCNHSPEQCAIFTTTGIMLVLQGKRKVHIFSVIQRTVSIISHAVFWKIAFSGLAETNVKVKNDHHSKFSNLSNWKEEAWKNQGFNGIRTRDLRDTGAMLYQLIYEATHWERGQFIEFISPVRSEMMWSIYEIIHIYLNCGCRSKWRMIITVNFPI